MEAGVKCYVLSWVSIYCFVLVVTFSLVHFKIIANQIPLVTTSISLNIYKVWMSWFKNA